MPENKQALVSIDFTHTRFALSFSGDLPPKKLIHFWATGVNSRSLYENLRISNLRVQLYALLTALFYVSYVHIYI